MASQFPPALAPQESDVQKLLAVQAHIGTKNLEPSMERYVWKRRADGVHIIDLQKTWEKLVLAARIIAAIEHPTDICVISGKPFSQRAVLKFGHFTGANSLAGRYTPGTFTNQIQAKFMEPRLLVLSDPRTDHQPLTESSYVNIPTIAFCNTDSPVDYVDVVIPCNTKGKHAVGLLWYLLCREVLYLKNVIPRGTQWEVMPDLFFFRDPTEEEKEEEEKSGFNANPTQDNAEQPTWDPTTTEGNSWDKTNWDMGVNATKGWDPEQ